MPESGSLDRWRGRFIVLDGPDGCGKTTQLHLLAAHLEERGLDVRTARDPGGTAIGDKIRDLLLDRDNGEIDPMCEMMLFMASRAQLVAEVVRPALAAGRVVLCDRFVSATVAYQGASGIDPKLIVQVGEVAVAGLWPELTIVLDVPPEVGMSRVGSRSDWTETSPDAAGTGSPVGDRMEVRGAEYHAKVRENYRRLGEVYPAPVVGIDAARPREEVFADLLAALEKAGGHA